MPRPPASPCSGCDWRTPFPAAGSARSSPPICRSSINSLRKRGRHLQIGLTSAAEHGEIALPIDLIVLREATVIGSLGMQAPRFGAMLDMVEKGKLAPGKLVHQRIKLEEVSGVLENMDRYANVGVTVIDRY